KRAGCAASGFSPPAIVRATEKVTSSVRRSGATSKLKVDFVSASVDAEEIVFVSLTSGCFVEPDSRRSSAVTDAPLHDSSGVTNTRTSAGRLATTGALREEIHLPSLTTSTLTPW